MPKMGGKKWTLFQPDEVIEDVQCAPIEAEESIKLVYYGTCRMANHNSSLYFDWMCGAGVSAYNDPDTQDKIYRRIK